MLSPNELAIEWGRNCSMKEFLVKKYKLEYQTLENFTRTFEKSILLIIY